MRIAAAIAFFVFTLSAGTVIAGPDNFGGNGQGWSEESEYGIDYYQHGNADAHTKNFDSSQGAGKRFSQPGKAEGKADDSSVIQVDGMHPGTQILPGGNR